MNNDEYIKKLEDENITLVQTIQEKDDELDDLKTIVKALTDQLKAVATIIKNDTDIKNDTEDDIADIANIKTDSISDIIKQIEEKAHNDNNIDKLNKLIDDAIYDKTKANKYKFPNNSKDTNPWDSLEWFGKKSRGNKTVPAKVIEIDSLSSMPKNKAKTFDDLSKIGATGYGKIRDN